MISQTLRRLGPGALLLLGLAACRTATPGGDPTPELGANKLAGTAAPSALPADTAAAEPPDAAAVAGAEQVLTDLALAAEGDQAEHVLSALAGQTLRAKVRGVSQGAVRLEFLGPDGSLLASNDDAPPAERNSLSAIAAADGAHILRVSSDAGAPALSYDLTLWLEEAAPDADDAGSDEANAGESEGAGDGAAGDGAGDAAGDAVGDGAGDGAVPTVAAAPAAPKRIRFQAGSDGGAVKGSMAGAGEQQRFLLEARAGQVMAVTLMVEPAGAVDLMVFSPDERPMRPLATGAGEGDGADDAALRFPLPADGDYSLSLSAGQAATWTLEILLEEGGQSGIGGAGGMAVGSAPTRLIFGPGNQATRVQGLLSAGAPQRFVLRGEAGQILALSLEAAAGPQVFVEGPQGRVLAAGPATSPLEVPLPASQDYWVTVLAPPRSGARQIAVNIGLQ